MKNLLQALGLTLLIALPGSWVSGTERIDPGSAWAIQFDMAAFRETELGQAMRDQSDHPKMAAKLQFFADNFRFDPWVDLQRVTLYGSGVHGQGVSVIRGNFDPDWLISKMEEHGGISTGSHAGIETHRIDKGHSKHVAFMGNEVLLMAGTKSDLQEAIEIQLGERESGVFGLDGSLAENRGAFYFGFARVNELEKAQNRPVARSIRYLESVVSERDGDVVVGGVVEATDVRAATGILYLSQGMAVLAEQRMAEHRHAKAWIDSLVFDQVEENVYYEMRLETGFVGREMLRD